MKSLHSDLGAWTLFRIWTSIGLQSFGGGASTTLLIQQAFTEKHNYLTTEELVHFWNLCIPTPGINLVALTILIGKRLGGGWGVVVSLIGLLLPSALITCMLTAIFQQIEHLAAVQAVIRGIVPATGAVMFLVGVNFARPLLHRSYKAGALPLLASCIVILTCSTLVILFKLPAIAIVPGTILLGALWFQPGARLSSLPREESNAHD